MNEITLKIDDKNITIFSAGLDVIDACEISIAFTKCKTNHLFKTSFGYVLNVNDGEDERFFAFSGTNLVIEESWRCYKPIQQHKIMCIEDDYGTFVWSIYIYYNRDIGMDELIVNLTEHR